MIITEQPHLAWSDVFSLFVVVASGALTEIILYGTVVCWSPTDDDATHNARVCTANTCASCCVVAWTTSALWISMTRFDEACRRGNKNMTVCSHKTWFPISLPSFLCLVYKTAQVGSLVGCGQAPSNRATRELCRRCRAVSVVGCTYAWTVYL